MECVTLGIILTKMKIDYLHPLIFLSHKCPLSVSQSLNTVLYTSLKRGALASHRRCCHDAFPMFILTSWKHCQSILKVSAMWTSIGISFLRSLCIHDIFLVKTYYFLIFAYKKVWMENVKIVVNGNRIIQTWFCNIYMPWALSFLSYASENYIGF